MTTNMISDSDWPASEFVQKNAANVKFMRDTATRKAWEAIHAAQRQLMAEQNRKEQMLNDAERESVRSADIAAGAVIFKSDAGAYRPTKKQIEYAGKLAREIRDLGVSHSAHSLAKHFTIDTLIAIRDTVKSGKKVVLDF